MFDLSLAVGLMARKNWARSCQIGPKQGHSMVTVGKKA
jgi:hypothetical protein